MLSYSLLKDHAGILLVGDHTSLTWLHESRPRGEGPVANLFGARDYSLSIFIFMLC